VLGGLGLCAVLGFLGLLVVASAVSGVDGERVALIEINGAISDGGAVSLLGGSGGAREFIRQVAKAREDKTIKAVVIRINSPGGSSAASQEMYQAVRRLRAQKPVIASMADVAASGGYYVAAACDKIYANPSTLTGSIGVITEMMNYQNLFKKVGVDTTVIKSGKFKDAGNPARPLTAEEKQLFQAMVNDVYQQFVSDVVDGRKAATKGKLTRAKLLKIADGRVFTGRRAKEALLVDETGGLYEAINEAGQLGKIQGTPKVKTYGGGALGSLFGAESSSPVQQIAGSAGQAFARGAITELKAESQSTPELR
jgi:protease-4